MFNAPSMPAPEPAPSAPASSAPTPTSKVWHSHFGDILIETHADGSVSVNGKVVQTTTPPPAPGAAT